MFKIDYLGNNAVLWEKQEDQATYTVDESYYPKFYISGPSRTGLQELRMHLIGKDETVYTRFEDWKTGLEEKSAEDVLRVDTRKPGDVKSLAYRLKKEFPRDKYRYFNIDLLPQFRYCLENQIDPTPSEELENLEISLPEKSIANNDLSRLQLNGRELKGLEQGILEETASIIKNRDPDVLIVNSSNLLELLYQKAEKHGIESFYLGRLPGRAKLAGRNTYESYGQVGHSPARHNIPGRVVINTSNSFFLNKTSLAGILDLVQRSWMPLQEAAWKSIGGILTAIQTRKAYLEKNVLIPWNKWSPEEFKSVDTLHQADRGGFIFQPKTGLHEKVYELDFSSLYPNIMIEHNISPETVGCSCHSNQRVPELGYTICDKKGFIPEVLEPLVNDRDEIKKKIESASSEEEKKRLESISEAIKWVLVSCFGYQGYRNAKFGRIECHEAINAYAREIMLQAKKVCEENGYEVVHGIIDSLWVKQDSEDAADVKELAQRVSQEVDIELEYEREYDWIAFVPRRGSATGALTRYFGKHENGFKVRGVELRQRSTCGYIKRCQELLMKSLDKHREPERVIEVLKKQLTDLNSGGIDTDNLVIKKRCTKSLEAYRQNNRTVAALKRYRDQGIEKNPGEDVAYVVVDDSRKDRNRVRLPFEKVPQYDEEFYTDLLIRAAESILSPVGWKRGRIKAYLSHSKNPRINSFIRPESQ